MDHLEHPSKELIASEMRRRSDSKVPHLLIGVILLLRLFVGDRLEDFILVIVSIIPFYCFGYFHILFRSLVVLNSNLLLGCSLLLTLRSVEFWNKGLLPSQNTSPMSHTCKSPTSSSAMANEKPSSKVLPCHQSHNSFPRPLIVAVII